VFLTLCIASTIWVRSGTAGTRCTLLSVSFLGILFAGYVTFGELPVLFAQGLSVYMLGLPTCALGRIFYIAIFVVTVRAVATESAH
jgi:hypothetical protein